jgi:hypothetical protein
MFKTLFSHFVYEKAIDILFQRISKNFPQNPEIYSKIFIKNSYDSEDTMFMILYNVELNDSTMDSSLYALKFEYFKYSNTEYDWENEINLSPAIKQLTDEWYEVRKDYIARKI